MSIAVGIPLSRKLDWRTVRSTYGLINDVHGDIEFIVEGSHDKPIPIELARNKIADKVLSSKHEWLLFFDSDATAEYGTLTRLLSWNEPIVSALCFKRREIVSPAFQLEAFDAENFNPYRSVEVDLVEKWIGKYGQLNTPREAILPTTPEGSLLEVDRVGTHCLLIHRDVLEAVPEPRFERITAPGSGATGSDYDFCIKARRAGYKIYVDLSVISGHLDGTHALAGQDFMMGAVYMNEQRRKYKLD